MKTFVDCTSHTIDGTFTLKLKVCVSRENQFTVQQNISCIEKGGTPDKCEDAVKSTVSIELLVPTGEFDNYVSTYLSGGKITSYVIT